MTEELETQELEEPTELDNLPAAINQLATTLTPQITRAPRDDQPKAEILIRSNQDEKTVWQTAAQKQGKSLNEFVRQATTAAAQQLLECQHPTRARRNYPWSEVCLDCSHRFR